MFWLMVLVGLASAGPVDDALARTAELRALRMAEGVPPISADEYAKAQGGDVVTGLQQVEGFAARKSYGVALLDVPIERLWAAINDESLHVKYTSLTYAELVKGEACQSGRHVFQFLPVDVPFVQPRWWVTIRTVNTKLHEASKGEVMELVWRSAEDGRDVTSEEGKARMEEGLPVGFTRGSWLLTKVDDKRTLVEYYTWVDPGGSLSPKLMAMFAGKTLKKTLTQMAEASKDPKVACLPGA